MAKAKRGRPASSAPAKIIVNSRVRPGIIEKLDALAAEIRPQPTRSEMVALAVEEYVERHDRDRK